MTGGGAFAGGGRLTGGGGLAGVGGLTGRLAGPGDEVQPASTATSRTAAHRHGAPPLTPVIAKLQLDLEVLGLEKGDYGL